MLLTMDAVRSEHALYPAIDIGGTFIKYGIVDATGSILARYHVPTVAHDGREAVVARVADIAKGLVAQAPGRPIGIGVPGVVDPQTKRVQSPPNLPGWDSVPLADLIADATGVPVVVENDANAAAIAECRAGAGRAFRDFLYVTLGTGVGGGVIIDGQLYTGPHGDAGEIGHIHIHPGTVLERVIGRMGILERYQGGDGVDVADIDARAIAGEEHAQQVLDETGRLLGIGLCSAMAVLGLRTVIIGGGISRSVRIIDHAERTIRERAIPTIAANAVIMRAQFVDDAGLVGAAMLTM